MTDTTPVATLTSRLPKGNGLARAVPVLFDQRGALVPFVGYMRVEETGLDAEDVQHLRGSIARLELCLGPLERDGKDLIARASHQANNHPGQMTLMAEPGTAAAKAEERDRYVGYLREWQSEQSPTVSDADAAERWKQFSDGHYGALDQAAPEYLREFLLTLGALPDQRKGEDQAAETPAEPDDEATADDEPAAAAPKKPRGKVVPFQQPAAEQ